MYSCLSSHQTAVIAGSVSNSRYPQGPENECPVRMMLLSQFPHLQKRTNNMAWKSPWEDEMR